MRHMIPAPMRRLAGARSGVALTEFALSLPFVMTLGMFGVELSNFAITQMRVSQVAIELADNASRVGAQSGLAEQRLRESDINDVFHAARIQGARIDLARRGRVTLSSLEAWDGRQRIHWQRCLGLKQGPGYDSSYGSALPTDGSKPMPETPGPSITGGMGPEGARVTSPPNSGVMFVEVNYDYRPIIAGWLIGPRKIAYLSSFIVRDRRSFSQIYDSSAETRSSCDKYNI